jgi:hypothetical protein
VSPGHTASYGQLVNRPRLSPALFALICLGFILPFATVSCDNAETSFTGIQLVTHTVPAGGAVDDDCGRELGACVESKGSFLAAFALGLALVGLLLGLLGRVEGPGWFATGGLLSMLGLAGQAAVSFATVELHVGYWLVLLLFFCAVCLHARNAVRRRRSARAEEAQPQQQAIV